MSESNEKAMKQNFLYVLVNMVSHGSFVAPNGNQTPMNFKFEDGKLYIEEKTKKNQYKHSIDYTYLDEKEKSLKGWYLLETSARPKKTQYIIEVENAYYEPEIRQWNIPLRKICPKKVTVGYSYHVGGQ